MVDFNKSRLFIHQCTRGDRKGVHFEKVKIRLLNKVRFSNERSLVEIMDGKFYFNNDYNI